MGRDQARMPKRGLWWRATRWISSKSEDTLLNDGSPARPLRPKFGLRPLYDPGNSVTDIVFVHGIMGDREKTWTAKGASHPWPQTILPSIVPEARILTYGYDAQVVDLHAMISNSRISNHSKNFLAALATYREGTEAVDRPIIFVAHSMGGLIVKDALVFSKSSPEKHLRKIQECTYGILFLATPHVGSSLASYATRLAKSVNLIKRTNSDLVAVLQKDSEVLERIQSEFLNMLRRREEERRRPIGVTCFYEELPMKILGDVLVTRGSAIMPGYKNIGIHADHREMARFASKNDSGFISVAGELRRWLDEIASTPSPAARATMGSSTAFWDTGANPDVGIHAGQISIMGSVAHSNIVGGSQVINGPLIFN